LVTDSPSPIADYGPRARRRAQARTLIGGDIVKKSSAPARVALQFAARVRRATGAKIQPAARKTMNEPPIKGDWRAHLRDSWRNIPGEVTASGITERMDDPLLDMLGPSSDCNVVQRRPSRRIIARRKRS
jgi:hypothetical protein